MLLVKAWCIIRMVERADERGNADLAFRVDAPLGKTLGDQFSSYYAFMRRRCTWEWGRGILTKGPNKSFCQSGSRFGSIEKPSPRIPSRLLLQGALG